MPDISDIPMMFRAQVKGRNQLHYIDSDRQKKKRPQDSEIWVEQWTKFATKEAPTWSDEVKTRKYQFAWRFVTNGGQDDGITRPVITTTGLPFYPGSSMKGAFLRACRKLYPDKVELYCGSKDQPGILRFHGGYPTNDWKNQLLDIVHPQQDWQVKTINTSQKDGGAYALVSLYEPILKFGISSTNNLDKRSWNEVWQIWEMALTFGLGCKTSSGYGAVSCRIDENGNPHPITIGGEILFQGKLKGQGQASKLLDGTSEFRPNIFRAAIRGHALRIFGGITNEVAANEIVNDLFGSIKDRDAEGSQNNIGKLAMNFIPKFPTSFKKGGQGRYEQDIYENVQGEVIWQIVPQLSEDKLSKQEKKVLRKLVNQLMLFAMLLGGFGNSWRRIDHGKFHRINYEKVIGCHWQWLKGEWENPLYLPVSKIEGVTELIEQLRDTACKWLESKDLIHNPDIYAPNWRESWHPDTVQVWGRMANSSTGSEAIRWLHHPYQNSQTIRNTNLTGRISQIGRLWHRMYPLVRIRKNKEGKLSLQSTEKEIEKRIDDYEEYIELLTIFPDNSNVTTQFLEFLDSEKSSFRKLWPKKTDEPTENP